MIDLKLYTYKNKSSLKLIPVEDKKNQIISYVEIKDDLDNEKEYYIDLSSVGDALKAVNKNPGLLFNIEQILYNALSNYNVKFICQDSFCDALIETLPLLFEGKEELLDEEIEEDKDDTLKTENNKIRVRDLNEEEFNKITNCINEELVGHNKFKKSLKNNLDEFRLFNKLGEHKILSIFIFGESGIGKTQVARLLHKSISINEKMIKISFGNYSSQGSLNSLIGSPRGYIGSEDGELNTKIEKSKSTVILIDEFEKADKSIINFFLELLEEGKYTDMQGVEHDLDGYIIVFTSNLNENNLKEHLTPEFYNRLNMKIKFNLLNEEDKKIYLNRRINELVEKYNSVNAKKLTSEDKKIFDDINVSKYNSIRDIELQIKKRFIDLANSNKT